MRAISGVELRTFGDALAVATPGRADVHWMNMVEFVYDASLIDDILAWYRSLGLVPTISTPSAGDPSPTSRALVSAGLHPWRTLSVLYGRAAAPLPGPTDAVVRVVAPGDIGTFATTWADGYEHTGALREWALRDVVAWPSLEGFTLYLAELDGRPAGAAVLAVREGIGYLMNASTIPAMRGRGVHGALIERRIADASASGCELICGLAAYAGVSQNNMERIGLRLAGTITQWRPLDAG